MDIGIQNFLMGKYIISRVEQSKVLKSFTEKYGTKAHEDFTRFATFVDQGIRSGMFNGKAVKLLTDCKKVQIEKEKAYRYFANQIPKLIWDLWKVSKNNNVASRKHSSYSDVKQLLLKYFNDFGLPVQEYNSEEDAPKCYEFLKWYQYIIDNNLSNHFIKFCKGE